MKPSQIIKLSNESYKFKLKYSTLCDLNEVGINLMSEEGSQDLMSDPNKLRLVFWKGLETGEKREFEKEEAFDIFDQLMEEVGPGPFAEIIPKALAIKTDDSLTPVKN